MQLCHGLVVALTLVCDLLIQQSINAPKCDADFSGKKRLFVYANWYG